MVAAKYDFTITNTQTMSNIHNSTSKLLKSQDVESVRKVSFKRQYKLPPGTPMFMAEGRSCDDWFFCIDNQLYASGIPDEIVLPLLSNYVNGTALQLLKSYMREGKNSWTEFKTILRNTFQPIDFDFRTRAELHHLKQGNDSIDNYNRNFLRLSTQISSLTLDEIIFKYKIGLDDRTRYEVERKNPRSLEQAIATATQYEHSNRKGLGWGRLELLIIYFIV